MSLLFAVIWGGAGCAVSATDDENLGAEADPGALLEASAAPSEGTPSPAVTASPRRACRLGEVWNDFSRASPCMCLSPLAWEIVAYTEAGLPIRQCNATWTMRTARCGSYYKNYGFCGGMCDAGESCVSRMLEQTCRCETPRNVMR